MHCCVPFCKTVGESKGVTFYKIPNEDYLRDAWLRALGTQDTHMTDLAMVCSLHFLNDDIYKTDNGLRQIYADAIPSMVQVCMMCLDTRSKLLLMNKYKLDEAYANLVGTPVCNKENLKQTLCIQCAWRLMNFSKFRDKSLRARSLMLELVKKHKLITIQHMELLNDIKSELKYNLQRTVLNPDHCDLYIDHTDEDKHKRLKTTAVKNENCQDFSQSVDKHYYETDVRDTHTNEECYGANIVVTKEEYLSDDDVTRDETHRNNSRSVKSSSSKSAETSAPIKQSKKNRNPDGSTLHYDYGPVGPSPRKHATKLTIQNEISTTAPEEPVAKKLKVIKRTGSVSKTRVLQCNSVNSVSNAEKDCENSLKNILYQNLQSDNNSVTEKFTEVCGGGDFLKCQYCQYKTKHKAAMAKHARRTHARADRAPFACDICEYKCTQSNVFVEHTRIHTGEKPFACNMCDHRFARKSDYMRHTKIHMGSKPFTCEFCEHRFTRNSDLVRHKRTHTGEKPYACEFCVHKFSRNSDLVNHTRTHTGEKPYACDLCGRRCARSSELLKHMKTHIGETPVY